eukprot:m51a1_g7300 hypothetical protein (717) ;mRNA; f:83082-85320
MKVSFRALLVATVCAAVWIPMIAVVVLFNARSQSLLTQATEERLPPTVVRIGSTVFKSLLNAESVARQLALEISLGSLVLVDTPEGLHDLRVRWHNVLRSYNSTSDVNFVTAEGTEHPGRLIGMAEFGTGENLWWYSHPNATMEQWQLNVSSLEPIKLEQVDTSFAWTWLAQMHSARPAGAEECWMPIYSVLGQVWSTFVVNAYQPNTTGANRPLAAYAAIDLVFRDLTKVFAGLTVSKGVSFIVDSVSSTLLASTSEDILTFRQESEDVEAMFANGTRGKTADERRVAAVDALVQRKYGSWAKLSLVLTGGIDTPSTSETLKVDGNRMLVSFSLVERPCLSWVIAVVAEQDSVSVDIVPIIVAIATTFAALVVLAILSVLLTRPLAKLTRRMNAATRLTFQRRESDISLFSEFYKLNNSFKKLSTGIEAMTKFVPMPVVSQIMSHTMAQGGSSQDDLLAVSMKRVTIMFCDIRGFTTLSEKLKTKVVVQMLFEWLGAYTKVIVRNGGIVDKYIGDCIMALWNAPLDTDRPDVRACTAALEFDEVLKDLNEGFRKEGLPEFAVRVGIHTGELFVGNIGCSDHINYTVCGTPANIAARVEQLGKVYGLNPLVSGDVAKSVSDKFVCVWLDDVKLRGHESTVTKIYHLAARANEATPEQLYAAKVMTAIDEPTGTDQRGNTSAEQLERVQDAAADPAMAGYHAALAALASKFSAQTQP